MAKTNLGKTNLGKTNATKTNSTRTNLDTDLLRTFVMGVQYGSFSRAAEAVGRSQSAVSLQMRRLEEQAGGRLFRRDGRSLALSAAGETLYGYAMRILDLNDEALDALARQEVEGVIRIGLPPDLAESWLPRLLARFMRTHPGVAIEAQVDRNAHLLDDIAGQRLDVALVWDRAGPGEAGAGGHIAELPVIWIAAAANPPPAAPLPLVVMTEPCLFRAQAVAALEAAGIASRVTFTSASLAGVWAATSAGLGVTVRTAAGLPPDLAPLVQPALPSLGTVSLRVHTAEAPSRSVRHFTALLIDTVREGLERSCERPAPPPRLSLGARTIGRQPRAEQPRAGRHGGRQSRISLVHSIAC